ncbi:isochorismatase family protein [Rothia santali]|uniref:isochorismatase family protein n=1 Tax=Rothia santali TaxID=2949643 RepID=UPI0028158DAC|nr:isochorismatase family protein [Rothia santali]
MRSAHREASRCYLGSRDGRLRGSTEHRIRQIVLAGIQTNMCVETTARVGGNLGYDVVVPLDATRTFELRSGGRTFSADELSAVTAANLSEGGFARVTDTESVLKA